MRGRNVSLQEKLDAHRKLAEATDFRSWSFGRWGRDDDEWPYKRLSISYEPHEGTLVAVAISPRYVSRDDAEPNFAHIAANDPDTVLALIAVAEAAQKVADNCECYERCFGELPRLESALAHLEEVLT